MPAPIEPDALARLVDLAERPRAGDWSLRAALVRYAQPQPARASAVVELLRRLEGALRPSVKVLERQGPAVWDALSAETDGDDAHASSDDGAIDSGLVDLLRAAAELDRLGDELATWAVDRQPPRPDAAVDTVTADVASRFEALGVPHEERPRPTRARR